MRIETKKIRIKLTATVRKEHFEVIEVPCDITDEQLAKLIDTRQVNVDRGRYIEEPATWAQGESSYRIADAGEEVDCKATFYSDGGIDTESVWRKG
jgi:hypothetical protein